MHFSTLHVVVADLTLVHQHKMEPNPTCARIASTLPVWYNSDARRDWLAWHDLQQGGAGVEGFHVRSVLVVRLFWSQLRALFLPWFLGLLAGTTVIQLMPIDSLKLVGRFRTLGAVLVASAVGAVSPFPVLAASGLVISLSASGFSFPPLLAFLAASPLLDPTMFTFTLLSLGPRMAFARLAAAIAVGSLAGILAAWLARRGRPVELACVPASDELRCEHGNRGTAPRQAALSAWWLAFLGQFCYAGRYFLLAIIVTAWITVYVPRSWIAGLLGASSRLAVPGAALLGVPAYSCGGGASP